MIRYTILLALLIITSVSVIAQIPKPDPNSSWKKRWKTAQQLEEQGEISSAAEYYRSVFTSKPTKLEAAHKAGLNFLKVRDYLNASRILKEIKDKNGEFDKVGFKYANALKQSGKYEEAAKEFESFINNYKGRDVEQMSQQVEKEIAGCTLALNMVDKDNLDIDYLTEAINTPSEEYGPIPFTNEVLYYSSDFEDGKTQIYRSIRRGKAWTRPRMPSIFRGMEKNHFGNGAFAPDHGRFYFTQCEYDKDHKLICELYVIQRTGQTWSLPEKLPEAINEPGANTSMPFVTIQDGQEVIYFASTKSGGYGGMDIWFTTKDLNDNGLRFSTPENLGESVNSSGDEVTPFYQDATQTLYFSSNGHVNIGGFDVFKSEGSRTAWSTPVHLGKPVNSAADDVNYILMDNEKTGYVSSNRVYGDKKDVTTDNDIFRFDIDEQEVIVNGSIYELGNPSKSIKNVIVGLFEITANGSDRLLNTKIFPDGNYSFALLPDREYKIEAEKAKYVTATYRIKTNNPSINLSQDLVLEKVTLAVLPPGNRPSTAGTQPSANDVEEAEPEQEETVSNVPGPPGGKFRAQKPNTSKPAAPKPQPQPEPEPSVVNVEEEEVQPTKVAPPGPSSRTNTSSTTTATSKPISPRPIEREEPAVTKPEPTKPAPTEVTSTFIPPKKTGPYQPPKKNNVFKVIDAKRFSELSRSQILSITYVDSKPYVETEAGYIEVLDDDDESTASTPTTVAEEEVEDPFDGGRLPPKKIRTYGTSYKIQLAAVSEFKPRKFTDVGNIGEIQLEKVDGKNLTRVMVVSYDNLQDAKSALLELNARGFDRAFITRYENGKRAGGMIRMNR